QGIRDQVTPKQSSRLGMQAIEPFQSVLLPPWWRALDRAGVKIERCANADHDRVDTASMSCHPCFLLGASQPDKDYLRAGPIDDVHLTRILFDGRSRKRWRTRTANPEAGKSGLDDGFQFFQ